VIDDLDRSVAALLTHELPPTLVTQVNITFATPDAQFPPSSVTLPAIDLFLYDVRENVDLRSREWEPERLADGSVRRAPPPMRVDCSYLITAWPSASSTTPALDEHRLLSEVLKVLVRHRTLPPAVLQGSLAGQELPLPTTTLQPSPLQSSAEFWQALGGRPKAALNCVLTIGIPVGEPVSAGAPVIDERIRLRSGLGGP